MDVLRLLALITLAVAFLAGCGSSLPEAAESKTSPTASRASAETPAAVPYQVARRWPIPAGGTGRSIFIDPKYSNEADLRHLGEQLRRESPDDSFSFVFVFDTERAARLQGTFDNSDEDHEHYMRHTVGEYTRNGSTGYHRFHGTPGGIMGPAFDVSY